MNSYGHPHGPEIAMLDELHTLWGRVFSGGQRKSGRVVLALASVASAITVAWLLV